MLSFTELHGKRLKRLLTEATDVKALKNLIQSELNNPTVDARTLEYMVQAIERPKVEDGVKQLFDHRGLSAFFSKEPGQRLISEIMKAKGSVPEKVDFLEKMLAGKLFNDRSYLAAAKRGTNISKHVNSDPILKQLLSWMVAWTPQIDSNATVAVGPTEAFLILMSSTGKKGGDAGGGDVGMLGKLIEVKVAGGAMGKGGTKRYGAASNWFADFMKQNTPLLRNKSNNEILKSYGIGSASGGYKDNSIVINNTSLALHSAGLKDNEIENMWSELFKQATGVKRKFSGIVKKGVTNYDMFTRNAIAVAFEAYKNEEGFTGVLLLDKVSFDSLWFDSGDDFVKGNNSKYSYDQSLSWAGGGQGGALSPRLMLARNNPATVANEKEFKVAQSNIDALKGIYAIIKKPNASDRMKDKAKQMAGKVNWSIDPVKALSKQIGVDTRRFIYTTRNAKDLIKAIEK